MPRVNLAQPKRDYIKALVLERKEAYRYTDAQIAAMLGVSRQTFSRMLREHTDNWKLQHLKVLCIKLGIPLEELREAIRYR